MPGAMSDPHELPVEWRCVAVAAEMIKNTSKPFTFWFYDRASAKYYELPAYINVGLIDSKLPDAQAGLECGITLSLGAAAGADIFGHMGICGVDQAASLDILAMQSEAISYVESVNREIKFSEETFAVELIEEIGPGGNFIEADHTMEHFRCELWFPRLFNREYYDCWLNAGAKSMEECCKVHKEEILSQAQTVSLQPDVVRELDKIVASASSSL